MHFVFMRVFIAERYFLYKTTSGIYASLFFFLIFSSLIRGRVLVTWIHHLLLLVGTLRLWTTLSLAPSATAIDDEAATTSSDASWSAMGARRRRPLPDRRRRVRLTTLVELPPVFQCRATPTGSLG